MFVAKIVNPLQVHVYFTSALEVEGVRAIVPAEKNAGHGILKIPAYEYAEDMMRFDQNGVNVNEWHLGTMGEFPLDDLSLLKNSLDALVSEHLNQSQHS